MTYKCQGIVLKRRNLDEADRIFVIFTDKYGKRVAKAKGVRKILSKLAGHLEPFILSELHIHESNHNAIDTILGASSLDVFNNIRSDIRKLSLAYYFAELVDQTMQEKEVNEPLWELLKDVLDKLDKGDLKLLPTFFELNLLKLIGFMPNLEDKSDFHLSLKAKDLAKEILGSIKPKEVDKKTEKELKKAVHLFLLYHLERKIKSLEFLKYAKLG